MFLIYKYKGSYPAVKINPGDKWDFCKVLPGRTEVRIVLRIRGRRHLLYSTRALSNQYPTLKRAQLILLCDEIITTLSEQITSGQEYIHFERVASAVELRHRKHWCEQRLIPMVSLEEYFGHPVDPKMEILSTRVRVDLSDIILMDHEPPIDDVEQEQLPN